MKKLFNLKSLHSFFFAPKQAFTLVELIVVISVLAVLATISFSQVGNITKNARDASRTTSISNIKWSLEIFYAQKGRYPFPDNPITLTWAWNSKLYKWVITTAVLPWLNTDTKDPTTNSPYQYATLSNTHYQIGTNLEWATSLNQTLTNQTFADSTTTNTIPYIKWNYTFDPSLPSLFPIGTASGIFSPTTCFILESSTSPNNFSSTAADCTPKAQTSFKNIDTSLVGYWDMETKTGTLLKDMSGNGNHLIATGVVVPTLTGGIFGQGHAFHGTGTGGTTAWGNFYTSGAVTYGGSQEMTAEVLLQTKATCPEDNTLNTATYAQMILESSANQNTNTGSYAIADWDYSNARFSGCRATGVAHIDILPYKSRYSIIRASSRWISDTWKILTLKVAESKAWFREAIFYINGVEQTNYPTWYKEIVTEAIRNYPIFIWARSGWSWSASWVIDEVKIYNRALSDEEILQRAKAAGF